VRIVIDWDVSAFTGWGVNGLNLALEWARLGIDAATLQPVNRAKLGVDPLRMAVLRPFLEASALARGEPARPGDVRMVALGNGLAPGPALRRNDKARVGVVFFEEPLPADAKRRAKDYDVIVAGSQWNKRVLNDAGIDSVVVIYQGVDRSIFHPAPKRGLFKDRFVIFSGGKAEPRKGQDIVVKAFRIFAKLHPEALLVTAWHSPWPQIAGGMDLDLSSVADQVIDAGPVPNTAMAPVYRECDVGLFPNRCEGGTNLVAMECLACGVPAILSPNTGHLDIGDQPGAQWLVWQTRCEKQWGESDIDEIIVNLERIMGRHARIAGALDDKFQWKFAATDLAALAGNYARTTDVAA
jgi:glycosyltransferase involved in cell wall biosynthesis